LVKQRYEEKLTQVRAFGREKNLPRSIRTRLVSHYENIYPGKPRYRITRASPHPNVSCLGVQMGK
jgi:hypothetical protein